MYFIMYLGEIILILKCCDGLFKFRVEPNFPQKEDGNGLLLDKTYVTTHKIV